MTVRALLPLGGPVVSVPRSEGAFARESALLGAHYERCKGSTGRWFTIGCLVESLDSFVAPRFVTTLVVIGTVVAVGASLV